MTTVLPTEVLYGTVTWTALSAVADGADSDGNPDSVPVAGQVTFTPSTAVFLDIPSKVTVIGTPVTYTLDGNGVLRDSQGRAGVTLLATDSPGITPTGWTWQVTYRLSNGLTRGSFSFALPAGTTVDLTTVAPVSTSNGAPIIQGPKGDPGAAGGVGPPGPVSFLDSQGLPAILPLEGGGVRINRWTYPTWGYGGSGVDKNQFSPTLLDLADLGVSQMLWLPGIAGNFLSTPDNAGLSGNSAGVPQVLTLQANIVTNEWDPVTGQSNYYLVAKPNCWILRLTELGFVEARAFDATGGLTLTSTATFPTKTHMYVQAIITPNDGGLMRVDFNTSSDGGTTWDQLGDPVFAARALGAYVTTSGSPNGILVGGNTTGSLFRGGLVSAQVYVGATLAGEVRPSSWTAGGTGGTDTAGNVWTINAPQSSNWVTQTSVAVGDGEYINLTGSPTGHQLTTAGLYTSLTLSGFTWDLTKPPALAAYRDSNTVINTNQAALLVSWADLYIDAFGALVSKSASGIVTQIGAA